MEELGAGSSSEGLKFTTHLKGKFQVPYRTKCFHSSLPEVGHQETRTARIMTQGQQAKKSPPLNWVLRSEEAGMGSTLWFQDFFSLFYIKVFEVNGKVSVRKGVKKISVSRSNPENQNETLSHSLFPAEYLNF